MPAGPDLEPGEGVRFVFSWTPGESVEPFVLHVTDRSLYWPRKKRFAVRDPWVSERIRGADVRGIRIEPAPPYLLWVLSALMVLGGAGVLWLGLREPDLPQQGKGLGYSLAVLVVGGLLAFLAPRRLRVVVETVSGIRRWKSPIILRKGSDAELRRLLDALGEACRENGWRVEDRGLRELVSGEGMSAGPWERTPSPAPSSRATGRCCRCGGALVSSRWERWNGFLVACLKCGTWNGRRWGVHRVLWGSLILNLLSFFLTMRPLRALLVAGAFLAWDVIGVLGHVEARSEMAYPIWFGVVLLGPMIVNGILLIRHETLRGAVRR